MLDDDSALPQQRDAGAARTRAGSPLFRLGQTEPASPVSTGDADNKQPIARPYRKPSARPDERKRGRKPWGSSRADTSREAAWPLVTFRQAYTSKKLTAVRS